MESTKRNGRLCTSKIRCHREQASHRPITQLLQDTHAPHLETRKTQDSLQVTLDSHPSVTEGSFLVKHPKAARHEPRTPEATLSFFLSFLHCSAPHLKVVVNVSPVLQHLSEAGRLLLGRLEVRVEGVLELSRKLQVLGDEVVLLLDDSLRSLAAQRVDRYSRGGRQRERTGDLAQASSVSSCGRLFAETQKKARGTAALFGRASWWRVALPSVLPQQWQQKKAIDTKRKELGAVSYHKQQKLPQKKSGFTHPPPAYGAEQTRQTSRLRPFFLVAQQRTPFPRRPSPRARKT